jgi:hypothetical protein
MRANSDPVLPLRPFAGGEGRGEVGDGTAREMPKGHRTLPRPWRGPLPLPRDAAERETSPVG